MEVLGAIFSITIIDLALSGDNAAVIGLAIRNLPLKQRKWAALLGAGGAIAFRVALTALATLLLRVPYLNTLGGILLVWITWKLLAHTGSNGRDIRSSAGFLGAIGTIILADLSMSFDNVMGVAGAAQGSIPLMVFGLLISIPILVAGSSLLASLMNRYPILVYIGGAVLAHTAVNMFFHDQGLQWLQHLGRVLATTVPWGAALAVFLRGWLQVRQATVRLEAAEVAADLETLGSALEGATADDRDAAAR